VKSVKHSRPRITLCAVNLLRKGAAADRKAVAWRGSFIGKYNFHYVLYIFFLLSNFLVCKILGHRVDAVDTVDKNDMILHSFYRHVSNFAIFSGTCSFRDTIEVSVLQVHVLVITRFLREYIYFVCPEKRGGDSSLLS